MHHLDGLEEVRHHLGDVDPQVVLALDASSHEVDVAVHCLDHSVDDAVGLTVGALEPFTCCDEH